MVNHIRTALLNVASAQAPDAVYISPSFRPVEVPTALARIYDVVLSPNASDEERAYRVNTFMRLLHAADYESYVLLPDARITYDPTSQEDFFSTDDDPSSAINFSQLLSRVRAAVDGLEVENYGLFRPVSKYPANPDLMSNLRGIWNNDLSGIGRLTAAILALAYRLDDLNNGS